MKSNEPLEWYWFKWTHPKSKCYPNIDLCSLSFDVILGFNFWQPGCKVHDYDYAGRTLIKKRWKADIHLLRKLIGTVHRDSLLNRMVNWSWVWDSRILTYTLGPILFVLGCLHFAFGLFWSLVMFLFVRLFGWMAWNRS